MHNNRNNRETVIITQTIIVPTKSIIVASLVGYRLNFIDYDSAYRFRFFSIPSFDSNVIK